MRKYAAFWLLCGLSSATSLQTLHINVRGGAGGSFYEVNPNYIPYGSQRQGTSGFEHRSDAQSRFEPPQLFHVRSTSDASSSALSQLSKAMMRLYHVSPSIFYTAILCSVVFVLWQLPCLQPMLRQYFVVSHTNIARKRIPCILLSSISHERFFHLVGNLLVLLTFGPQVKQMLRTDIWPLLFGAAATGSAAYLLFDRNGNGSLGLSDITLAIVAVYARMVPKMRLTTVIAGLVPLQLEAHRLLSYLLASSVMGILAQKRSPIAHSSHLGGLLFGIAYYEVWRRYQQTSRT